MWRFSLPIWLSVIGIAFFATLCFADLSGSLDEQSILNRIKPDGIVTVESSGKEKTEAVALPLTGDIGKQRYDQYCHVCHGPGLAGAPKFGDKADWAPRIADGMAVMMKRAMEGYKAMPAKGTCVSCTPEEIQKAIEYMTSHSK